MLTRLITTDTRIKYLVSNPVLFNLPYPRFPLGSALPWITRSANPALSMVVRRLAGPLNRFVSHYTVPLLLRHHPGSSAIHPTSLSVSCHSQAYFANLSRRLRWHHLRSRYPISRCHQLARTYTDLPRGRESRTDVRSYYRRTGESYQVDF